MLKLISQFDNQKTRPSLATPTCCCCCCCCCVVTATWYTVVTTRMLLKSDNIPSEQNKTSQNMFIKLLPNILLACWILAFSLGVLLEISYYYEGDLGGILLTSGLIFLPVWFLLSLVFLRVYKKTKFSHLFWIAFIFLALFSWEFFLWLLTLESLA